MKDIPLHCVIFALLLCSCDRSEDRTQTTKYDSEKSQVEAKFFKKESFCTADGGSAITIISPEEIEYKLLNGTILLCKYTEHDNALRLVVFVNGTQQIIYFKRVPNGLSNDGRIYFKATARAEEQHKQELLRGTTVDAYTDQLTKWTPENIAKDPVNYLNFCEVKIKEVQLQMKADRIAVEQYRTKLGGLKADASGKIAVGKKSLTELSVLNEKAEDTKSWPVTWQNHPRDKDWVQTQMRSLDRQIEEQESILTKVIAGCTKLDARVGEIAKVDSDATAQLAEIATNRQLLIINISTDDLKVRLVKLKDAVRNVVNSAGDASGTLSLDSH